MKKNKHITFVALAAAVIATSCTSDDIAGQKQSQTGSQTVTLTASVNEGQTRVGMTKEGTSAKFYWHKGDKISVLTTDGTTFSNTEFSTTDEDGTTSAAFTGEVTGTVAGYALYPYNKDYKFDGTAAPTYNLPSEYTYTTVESNIFSKDNSYPSNSTNIPMLGKITDGSIAFKHIGGLAVIRIDKMPATSGTLTVAADQQLSGDFTVSDLSGTPTIATTTGSSSNNTVTFSFSGAASGSAGVFYLPLATGSYSGVKIEIANSTVDYGTLEVARAGVTAIGLYNNNGTIAKDIDKSQAINGHKFVDLGLPSGTLWAEMNVGANSATDSGTYYSWSDATSWNGWGSGCRLPTNAECQELINNCTWTWDSDKKGFKVTSKKSDNSIFLPAVGLKEDGRVQDKGSKGYYWFSDTMYGTLYFEHATYGDSNYTTIAPYDNADNCPIRAVANP